MNTKEKKILSYRDPEYKCRYKARFKEVLGVSDDLAEEDFDAFMEMCYEESPGNPEMDAEESASYWTD